MARNILPNECDENGEVVLKIEVPNFASSTIKSNAKIKDYVDQIM